MLYDGPNERDYQHENTDDKKQVGEHREKTYLPVGRPFFPKQAEEEGFPSQAPTESSNDRDKRATLNVTAPGDNSDRSATITTDAPVPIVAKCLRRSAWGSS